MSPVRVRRESWPFAQPFAISRGSRTAVDVVVVELHRDGIVGRGECVPYPRYGESVDGVMDQVEALAPAIEQGLDNQDLQQALSPGAARNGLDCALWDWRAKATSEPAWRLAGCSAPGPLVTAFTLSLDSPEAMGLAAQKHSHRPLLKLKLAGQGDLERVAAVRQSAPNARLIVDANEGWRPDQVEPFLAALAEFDVALVEQPLPAGQDQVLAQLARPVPVCADESCHISDNLERLCPCYEAVNIKLDKSGGLTEALRLQSKARSLGLDIMVGCMVGTSLAMAPALLLAGNADYVDLDGPLLLGRDRAQALHYEGSVVQPPQSALWG
ncbi:MAG: dipeptide epimerase [Candidatus Latescibacteria bacterium]|nr:dipeptide epimerase [Candidatus Latescibacterota bacterium]